MKASPLLLLPLSLAAHAQGDLRELYDVQAYRLDLRVEPEEKRLSGTVVVEAVVTGKQLEVVQLDMNPKLHADGANLVAAQLSSRSELGGAPLELSHENAELEVELPQPLGKGSTFRLAIRYSGSPRGRGFSGFHWARTPAGKPWINTSCQGPGAHSWWPCKASFYHPEDKPELLLVNLDVPRGLYGVSNGRLLGREPHEKDRELFRWRHAYPLETYSVTLNVAPYVVVEQELQLDGIAKPVPFIYYVLPADVEKAKIQFAEVPGMLEAYGKAFGPFPFPESKFALVETNFWGMEHSTAVAYGSSFPAWCKKTGARDRYGPRNRFFDYILVHESAHEWWGNAVSASAWGHFWIHEGFATYAESVYVEHTQGEKMRDRYFASIKRMALVPTPLFRGENKNSRQAYGPGIYFKGAWVLHTLRWFVADDALWWRSLREFNLRYRYKNAGSDEFRLVLEEVTGRRWKRFFDEWVYGGAGHPRIRGRVEAGATEVLVDVKNEGTLKSRFHVPLDLRWTEAGRAKSLRYWLAPGKNDLRVPCKARPENLRVVGLEKVLGRHKVSVQ